MGQWNYRGRSLQESLYPCTHRKTSSCSRNISNHNHSGVSVHYSMYKIRYNIIRYNTKGVNRMSIISYDIILYDIL